MQLEWAESVCRRWQLRMVVGTARSLLPLRSSSSSCSSRASLLQEVEVELQSSQVQRHMLKQSNQMDSTRLHPQVMMLIIVINKLYNIKTLLHFFVKRV